LQEITLERIKKITKDEKMIRSIKGMRDESKIEFH